MNNNLKLIDTDNIEQIINSIKDDLSTIKLNFDKNIIIPVNLYDLEEHLMSFYHHNKDKNINITDLISIDYLFFFPYSINKFEFTKNNNITNFQKLYQNPSPIYK